MSAYSFVEAVRASIWSVATPAKESVFLNFRVASAALTACWATDASPAPTPMAPIAVPARAAAFPTEERAPPSPLVMDRSAGRVLMPPSSRSTDDRNPFMEGDIWTQAVPRLYPATGIPSSLSCQCPVVIPAAAP